MGSDLIQKPKSPFHGSCMCGSVKVSLSSEPLLTVACHCLGCQKFSASAFSLTTMFPADAFSCTGQLVQGGLGLKGKDHFFCKSCKNFVCSRLSSAPDRVNIRTSILEQAASLVPFVEVMTDYKMPWVSVAATHSFATVPESVEVLQAIMDEYSRTGL